VNLITIIIIVRINILLIVRIGMSIGYRPAIGLDYQDMVPELTMPQPINSFIDR